MDVKNRQVFYKTFDSSEEQDLIASLCTRWICFDEITRRLGMTREKASRWIDALTLRCVLAEKDVGKFIHFKILNEQDFSEKKNEK